MSGEQHFEQKNMQKQTAKLETAHTLTRRLADYAAGQAYPFHMPGHKRRPGALGGAIPEALDITEIDGFDDLHDADGALAEAMERAARLYGSRRAWLLVNGSTCGLLAAIQAAAPQGSKVLVARNCHKAVYHGMELLGLHPVYLQPPLDEAFGIAGSLPPEQAAEALRANPDARLVILTSPTYEGVRSDVAAIARLCHEAGVPLLVDEAHGAHLGLPGSFAPGAVAAGADLVVQSLHKTLPSPTQTALLHWNSELVSARAVEHGLDIFETSSPSYPLMAAMDHCLRWLEADSTALMAHWNDLLERFSARAEGLGRIRVLCKGGDRMEDHPLFYAFDPGKLVISARGAGLTGPQLMAELRGRFQLELEMAAGDYAIAMTSPCDTEEGLARLAEALETLDREAAATLPPRPALPPVLAAPAFVLPAAQALRRPHEWLPPRKALGRVSGEYLWAYPPGIPILAPGERVDEAAVEQLEWLTRCGVALKSTTGRENCVAVLCKTEDDPRGSRDTLQRH